MGSVCKSFLILAVLSVIVLSISLEVAARDLTETNNGKAATQKTKAELGAAKFGGAQTEQDYNGRVYPTWPCHPGC
ncbi:hypothetical protein Gorai_019898 [Gossypium raimondii]|uniref:Uncharacterized protein n=1 Tax=Gossypium raimondii TaxID=29730 RepID=A0A0D2SN49_GOSRA|nr:hypothetical protein B456_007G316000 [Gossypium raimondii]MBA0591215.1 hypothetical protein [Gossypium raimondii]